jgi:SAM-dependent methyltransferase
LLSFSDNADPPSIEDQSRREITLNWFHRRYCAGQKWNSLVRGTLLPDALANVDLGDNVLELGAGPGLVTAALATRTAAVTAVEIDHKLAEAARQNVARYANVEVIEADATRLPFADGQFSAVVCMTMLHHQPNPAAQDRLFAEAVRVLRPGGVFCGSDNRGIGLRFHLIHLGDTKTVVPSETLADRLHAAGFDDASVRVGSRIVFRATTRALGVD